MISLLARTRSWLEAQLVAELSTPELAFHPEFSGRVALARVARAIRRRKPDGALVALVPDYICNVVPLAVARAGFSVEAYPTSDVFEPDGDAVMARLDAGDVGLLVTASVFGSSAMLSWLARDDVRRRLLRLGVDVVADLCQDITLRTLLPGGYGPRLSAVVSFNDKSFPGVMGGGVLTQLELGPHEPAPATLELRLYRRWIRRGLAKRLGRHVAPRPAYEFSYCRAFPFELREYPIQRIQIALALQGLRTLPVYLDRRARFASTLPGAVATAHHLTAPFLAVTDAATAGRRRRKASYALHHDPTASLRPELVILHNKGFDDEA